MDGGGMTALEELKATRTALSKCGLRLQIRKNTVGTYDVVGSGRNMRGTADFLLEQLRDTLHEETEHRIRFSMNGTLENASVTMPTRRAALTYASGVQRRYPHCTGFEITRCTI